MTHQFKLTENTLDDDYLPNINSVYLTIELGVLQPQPEAKASKGIQYLKQFEAYNLMCLDVDINLHLGAIKYTEANAEALQFENNLNVSFTISSETGQQIKTKMKDAKQIWL
ncbi:hypothetical protein CHS0354_028414, partial [Potamilus streckersoni]